MAHVVGLLDSSYSRTYLTKRNHHLQPIHKTAVDEEELSDRRRRNEDLKHLSPNRVRASSQRKAGDHEASCHAISSTNMLSKVADIDILRLPDSSDDESSTLTLKRKAPSTSPGNPSSTPLKTLKRPSGTTTGTRRSKRRRASEEVDGEDSKPLQKATIEIPEASNFDSSLPWTTSQSQKRRTAGYKSSQGKTLNMAILPAVDGTPKKTSKNIQIPGLDKSPSKQYAPMKPTEALRSSQTTIPQSSLQIPSFEDDLDADPDVSIDSTEISKPSVFDESGRARRGSTSSLSSNDSAIEYQLSPAQKQRLMQDDDGVQVIGEDEYSSTTHFRCPSCRRSTLKKGLILPKHTSSPSQLSITAQTKFCYQHRLRDARLAWKERGYPNIDWSSLADSSSPRLSKHVNKVISVVKRQQVSYYLDQLDAAVRAAKSNQSQINKYFDNTLLSIAHNGFYGPEGSKILAHTLASDKQLERAMGRNLRHDKILKSISVSRLIAAICVPEMLQNLVMEDMDVTAEEARKILEDSTEIGLLLCGDDDIVKSTEAEAEAD